MNFSDSRHSLKEKLFSQLVIRREVNNQLIQPCCAVPVSCNHAFSAKCTVMIELHRVQVNLVTRANLFIGNDERRLRYAGSVEGFVR